MSIRFTYAPVPIHPQLLTSDSREAQSFVTLVDDLEEFWTRVKNRWVTNAAEADAIFERTFDDRPDGRPGLATEASDRGQGAALAPETRWRYIQTKTQTGQDTPQGQRTHWDALHGTMHEVEKRLLSGGSMTGPLSLNSVFREFHARFAYRGVHPVLFGQRAHGATIDLWAGQLFLGRLLLDGDRFVPLNPQPANRQTDVLVDVDPENTRHYVRLPNGAYVRRFVIRGLSAYDAMQLSRGLALVPAHVGAGAVNPQETPPGRHNVPANTPLTDAQQILSHTRGWRKRYISTGASDHPVYSTRGTQFKSLFGAVAVDLAMIADQNSIVDIHQLPEASAQLGVNALQVFTSGHHLANNDPQAESYLAFRDVVRTRELLIKNQIDVAAICGLPEPATLVGIGAQTNADYDKLTAWFNGGQGLPAVLRPGLQDSEAHTFRDRVSNKKWIFLRFATSLQAHQFNTQAPAGWAAWLPQQPTQRFEVRVFRSYSPRLPAIGM